MRRILVLAALSGLCTPLAGQEDARVGLGSRVRVRTMGLSGLLDRGFEGTIERVSGDTLVLLPRVGGPARVFLPAADAQLFVYSGKHSQVARGAVIGTMAGLVAGGLVGMIAGKVCTTSDPLCPQRRQVVGKATLVLGSAGLAAGLLIGVLASHEHWTPSQELWAGRPALSIGPRGFDLGLALTF